VSETVLDVECPHCGAAVGHYCFDRWTRGNMPCDERIRVFETFKALEKLGQEPLLRWGGVWPRQ
jgi:hypothetical protein